MNPNDYDEDGNNIVPCPICMSNYCPSKEDGKCPEEDMFVLEGEIRMLLDEYKATGDNSRIANVLEAVEKLLQAERQRCEEKDDLLDDMWGLICNVNSGFVENEKPEWYEAFKRIRAKYLNTQLTNDIEKLVSKHTDEQGLLTFGKYDIDSFKQALTSIAEDTKNETLRGVLEWAESKKNRRFIGTYKGDDRFSEERVVALDDLKDHIKKQL